MAKERDREKEKEKDKKAETLNHLSIHQWVRSAIPDSQQPSSPIGFLFLKLPPPPCSVLLVYSYQIVNTPSSPIKCPNLFKGLLPLPQTQKGFLESSGAPGPIGGFLGGFLAEIVGPLPDPRLRDFWKHFWVKALAWFQPPASVEMLDLLENIQVLVADDGSSHL